MPTALAVGGVGMEARRAETPPPTACAGLAVRSRKIMAVGGGGSVHDSPPPFRGDARKTITVSSVPAFRIIDVTVF